MSAEVSAPGCWKWPLPCQLAVPHTPAERGTDGGGEWKATVDSKNGSRSQITCAISMGMRLHSNDKFFFSPLYCVSCCTHIQVGVVSGRGQ